MLAHSPTYLHAHVCAHLRAHAMGLQIWRRKQVRDFMLSVDADLRGGPRVRSRGPLTALHLVCGASDCAPSTEQTEPPATLQRVQSCGTCAFCSPPSTASLEQLSRIPHRRSDSVSRRHYAQRPRAPRPGARARRDARPPCTSGWRATSTGGGTGECGWCGGCGQVAPNSPHVLPLRHSEQEDPSIHGASFWVHLALAALAGQLRARFKSPESP